MKIKNIGGKIIRLGTLTLLPGEVASLPKDFENNPVVEHFVDMGLVEFEKKTEQLKLDKTDNENDQQAGGEQEPDDGGEQEPEDDGDKNSAPKPGTTRNGRGGRNK